MSNDKEYTSIWRKQAYIDTKGTYQGGKLLLAGFFALIAPFWAFAQGEAQQNATGLREETPEGLVWLQKNCPPVRAVKLNTFALERINAVRIASGLISIQAADVGAVPVGQEAVLADSPAGDVAAESSSVTTVQPLAVTSVDNSTQIWFPPIGNQNPVNSCVSWGITYYTYTYEVCRLKGWNAKSGDTSLIFSPKWTYNMVNGGTDAYGSSMSSTFNILKTHGAATLRDMPYDSNYRDWCLDPLVWKNAIRWRMSNYYSISSLNTSVGIMALKTNLLNGYICPFATYVSSWQTNTVADDLSTTNDNPYVGQRICHYVNSTNGAHIMTIVGYNDDIWCDINSNATVDAGEKGAFKVANSWGTGDWNSGYRWVAYDAFYDVSQVSGAPAQPGRRLMLQSSGTCYYQVARDYTANLYGKFTVNHASRDQMQMITGISASGATVPSTYISPYGLSNDGGAYAFDGTSTGAIDGTFYLDFSDLTPVSGTSYRFWLVGVDNLAGNPLTLKSFSVIDKWGGQYPGTNMAPASGIADGTSVSNWSLMAYKSTPSVSNYVSVSSGDTNCSEQGLNAGTFVVTRTDAVTGLGQTNGSINVFFTPGGTAVAGVDYQPVGTNILIPAGESNAVITITPIHDQLAEGTETVTVRLDTPAGYLTIDNSDSAALTLRDNVAPVVAIMSPASEYVAVTGTCAQIILEASVTDDGFGMNELTSTWSTVSGPAAVTFGDIHATNTTMYAPTTGTYVVRLTANNGWTQSWDELNIVISTNLQLGSGPVDSMVLWYKFDETTGTNALDSSGRGCTGSISGAPVRAPGRVDGGLTLGGVSDYVSFTNVAGLATGKVAHTVAGWVKVAAYPSYESWITLLGNETSGSHAWLVMSNGQVRLGLYSGVRVVTNIPLGEWHHLALTYDKTNSRGYMDGVLFGTSNATFNLQGISFTPGQKHGGSSDSYFAGSLDDMRVYSRTLSASEITNIIVQRPNVAPAVSAGSDLQVATGVPLLLNGVSSDDGKPNPPALLSTTWSRVSGSGNVVFSDPARCVSTAFCGTAGTLILRLTASDGITRSYDDVSVTVTNGTPLDSDGDGVSDLNELIAGTDPASSGTVFRLESISVDPAAGSTLSIPTATGRSYLVEWNTNILNTSGWLVLGTNFAGSGGSVILPDTNLTQQLYYRVKCELP